MTGALGRAGQGAGKSGTSSLYAYLTEHPSVRPAAQKQVTLLTALRRLPPFCRRCRRWCTGRCLRPQLCLRFAWAWMVCAATGRQIQFFDHGYPEGGGKDAIQDALEGYYRHALRLFDLLHPLHLPFHAELAIGRDGRHPLTEMALRALRNLCRATSCSRQPVPPQRLLRQGPRARSDHRRGLSWVRLLWLAAQGHRLLPAGRAGHCPARSSAPARASLCPPHRPDLRSLPLGRYMVYSQVPGRIRAALPVRTPAAQLPTLLGRRA